MLSNWDHTVYFFTLSTPNRAESSYCKLNTSCWSSFPLKDLNCQNMGCLLLKQPWNIFLETGWVLIIEKSAGARRSSHTELLDEELQIYRCSCCSSDSDRVPTCCSRCRQDFSAFCLWTVSLFPWPFDCHLSTVRRMPLDFHFCPHHLMAPLTYTPVSTSLICSCGCLAIPTSHLTYISFSHQPCSHIICPFLLTLYLPHFCCFIGFLLIYYCVQATVICMFTWTCNNLPTSLSAYL